MKEDFVSYDIAVKLKEKGYNCELPYAMYNEIGQFCLLTTSAPYHVCESGYKYREYYDYNDFDKNDFIAPTISQVLKWLRKEKKIFVDVNSFPTYSTKEMVAYAVDVRRNSVGYSMETVESAQSFARWEEAALAGIECVLNNLI